jgi:hypothetical protein
MVSPAAGQFPDLSTGPHTYILFSKEYRLRKFLLYGFVDPPVTSDSCMKIFSPAVVYLPISRPLPSTWYTYHNSYNDYLSVYLTIHLCVLSQLFRQTEHHKNIANAKDVPLWGTTPIASMGSLPSKFLIHVYIASIRKALCSWQQWECSLHIYDE